MIISSEYLINSRTLTSFHPLAKELMLNKEKNYLFNLPNFSVLDVQGEKAADFLQGQVTCDANSVTDIQMVQGAQCNLKGRILSLLDIINWHGLKLVIPTDVLELTQTALAKTALLSRVSIDKNTSVKVFGFYLQNPKDILPPTTDYFSSELFAVAYTDNYCYYHLGNGFYIFIVKNELATDFCNAFIEHSQLLGSVTWHTLMMKHGQVTIYPESRGLFLPHRLGLHLTSQISFNKGCYKGQEIIARMHYKSTVKHELKLFTIQTDAKLYSGQKLMNLTKDAEIGEIVDYSPLGDKCYLVAISILKQAADSGILEGHDEPVALHPAE